MFNYYIHYQCDELHLKALVRANVSELGDRTLTSPCAGGDRFRNGDNASSKYPALHFAVWFRSSRHAQGVITYTSESS